MTDSGRQTKRLLVYEFLGLNPPRDEPGDSNFLGMWPEPPFYYLFFADEPGEGLFAWLGRQRAWVAQRTYELAYDEWQQVGAERLRIGPFQIETLQAGPSLPSIAEGHRTLIRLDPGLVFGSGLHGSTKGCLLAIADLFGRIAMRSVVDMGTGTGILAISCGALGATKVLAVDKNPLAVRVAARNVSRNGLQDRIKLLVAEDLGAVRGAWELLIMNLEPPVLKPLLVGDDWSAYPYVILSGFLERQWDDLKSYVPASFQVERRESVDDWLTVTLIRSG